MLGQRTKGAHDYRISRLRIVCIVLVVLAHSIILYKNGWNLYNTNTQFPLFDYLCRFIYLFHMPLFFSISGYLAKYTYTKTSNVQTLARKKAVRLLVPYLAVGLLYLLPIRYLTNYSRYTSRPLYENIVFNIILGGDNGHLWYLASLFMIFIAHYLLIKYVSDKKGRLLAVAVLTLAGYFLPSYIGSALKNILWFHLGYSLSGDKDKLRFGGRYIAASVFVACMVAYFILPSSIPYYSHCLQLLSMAVSASVILLAYLIIPNRKTSAMGATIEKNSMGIYLFHSPLIYFSFAYFPDIHPILMLIINFFAFGGLALLLTIAIRKTKLRIVLGE